MKPKIGQEVWRVVGEYAELCTVTVIKKERGRRTGKVYVQDGSGSIFEEDEKDLIAEKETDLLRRTLYANTLEENRERLRAEIAPEKQIVVVVSNTYAYGWFREIVGLIPHD